MRLRNILCVGNGDPNHAQVPVITDLGPVLAAGGGLSAVLKLCRMKWTQDQELLLSRENGMNIRVTL